MFDLPSLPIGPGPKPPGDPAAIRDLARSLRLHAAAAERIGNAGGGALDHTPWLGRAATEGRARLRSWAQGLDGDAAQLRQLAARVDREADRVEAAQAAWKRKADRCEAAQAAFDRKVDAR